MGRPARIRRTLGCNAAGGVRPMDPGPSLSVCAHGRLTASRGRALFAFWIASRPAPAQQTYGCSRAGIPAPLGNGATLAAIAVDVFVEVHQRFRHPRGVFGSPIILDARDSPPGNRTFCSCGWVRLGHASGLRAVLVRGVRCNARVSWWLPRGRGTIFFLLMIWLRHSVPSRTLALLFLLWVGFDFGAHGLFASDLPPIAPGHASVGACLESVNGSGPAAPDHCFCHTVSMGAEVPAPVGGLLVEAGVLSGLSSPVPRTVPRSVDRPPQLPA